MLDFTTFQLAYKLILLVCISRVLCDDHGEAGTCDMGAATCQLFLEVGTWFPMRKGYAQKVYVNETDGMLYLDGEAVRSDDVVLADGSAHERVLILFNKTMPGPTLTVYVNQEVTVHVKNNLISDGITVHFHGIEMRGTPWMDGAAFVTQCPILPGQTFTYKFRPNRSGTYIYHSHTGSQMSMGLSGAFIVKEKKRDNMEEHILFVQDYNNIHTSDDIFTSGHLGSIRAKGVPFRPFIIDGTYSVATEVTSSLINGRGRTFDSDGKQLTRTPLSVFKVTQRKQYKFRVIGGGYDIQHKVSVDGHKMKVIAADGHDIAPITADFIIIHNGERFDFILEANQSPGNYWIRAETLHAVQDKAGYAILRYDHAEEDADPTSGIQSCTEGNQCIVVNCPFNSYPNWSCVHTDEMRSVADDPAPNATFGKFKEYFINFGFERGDDQIIWHHMNEVSLRLPTVSALTQPSEVSEKCDKSHNCGPEKVCFCNRPLDVNFGNIIQFTFYSRSLAHHPIHIHGYSVHVLKVGFRQTDASFANLGDNADVKCPGHCYWNASWANETWNEGNIPGVDLRRAPRKDTITVPAGGYAVVRFVVDNPGLWYIHCHQETHIQTGLGFLLNDSFSMIPPPPPGFAECRSFPPPDWIASRQTQTAESSTTDQPTTQANKVSMADARTFSEGEFWGMFGAFIFVILLQFILSIFCMRRSKSSMSF